MLDGFDEVNRDRLKKVKKKSRVLVINTKRMRILYLRGQLNYL